MTPEDNNVRKINLNWIKDKYASPGIKAIIYYKLEQKEFLYISFKAEDKKTKNEINEIICGIII